MDYISHDQLSLLCVKNQNQSITNSIHVPKGSYSLYPVGSPQDFYYIYNNLKSLLVLYHVNDNVFCNFISVQKDQNYVFSFVVVMKVPYVLKFDGKYRYFDKFRVFLLSVGSKWQDNGLKFTINVDGDVVYLKVKDQSQKVALTINNRIIKFKYGDRRYTCDCQKLFSISEYLSIHLSDLLVWFEEGFYIVRDICEQTKVVTGCLGVVEEFACHIYSTGDNGCQKVVALGPGEYIFRRLVNKNSKFPNK